MSLDEVLLGPRVESYWVEVLDERDRRVGRLDEAVGGRVSWNADAVIPGGLTLDVADADVNWTKHRLRPWVLVNNRKWPLGIYLPAVNGHSRSASAPRMMAPTCLDKLSILDNDKVERTYGVAAGTVVTTHVGGMITWCGETNHAITPSSKKLAQSMTWPMGTAKLQIINDLLDAIAYEHVSVDLWGQYQAAPWVDPRKRTPAWAFEKGDFAIHTDDIEVAQEISEVPNKVVVSTSGTDDKPALFAVATNTRSDSPHSYQARGERWVVKAYEGVDAVDQAALNTIASRNLWNSSTPPRAVTIQNAVIPVRGNELVSLTHDDLDMPRAIINEWSFELRGGSLMTTRLAEVPA